MDEIFEKSAGGNTNVFPTKTQENVGNSYKNPINWKKNRKNTEGFVKMTKIGIEIRNTFVYNVFIAAIEIKTAA